MSLCVSFWHCLAGPACACLCSEKQESNLCTKAEGSLRRGVSLLSLFLLKIQGQPALTHQPGAFLLSIVRQCCPPCCRVGVGLAAMGCLNGLCASQATGPLGWGRSLLWLGTEGLWLFIVDFCIWPQHSQPLPRFLLFVCILPAVLPQLHRAAGDLQLVANLSSGALGSGALAQHLQGASQVPHKWIKKPVCWQ